ncbi:hypothetical protein BJ741DRAFT_573238 [Chytriomyces cf. hyalinus JEL632]|nr:hypothetical protein BJ741DRAFT_573238 [Chytriomyces cf. hyalinus JEL632]
MAITLFSVAAAPTTVLIFQKRESTWPGMSICLFSLGAPVPRVGAEEDFFAKAQKCIKNKVTGPAACMTLSVVSNPNPRVTPLPDMRCQNSVDGVSPGAIRHTLVDHLLHLNDSAHADGATIKNQDELDCTLQLTGFESIANLIIALHDNSTEHGWGSTDFLIPLAHNYRVARTSLCIHSSRHQQAIYKQFAILIYKQ